MKPHDMKPHGYLQIHGKVHERHTHGFIPIYQEYAEAEKLFTVILRRPRIALMRLCQQQAHET